MKRDQITKETLIEMYNDAIDCDGDVQIGYITFSKSRILEELDPVAYNCGLSDFYDSLHEEYFCEDME